MTLSVTLLGTGCPVACVARRGAAQLVEADGARVLVDCGSGVAQQLVAAGAPGAAIDALLITHYHSDHMVDFYQLVVSAWHQGRDRPWIVHAPETAARHIRAQLAAWADERALRIAHERRSNGVAGLEVDLRPLASGADLRFGDLRVTPIEVDHRPITPAFGFSFAAGGARIVFSGDTAPCAALADAAQGADLLIHEVFIHAEMRPIPGRRSAETVAAVAAYHTAPEALADLAASAGVGALALTHFVPPAFDRAALLGAIRARFDGPVIVGEDLMRLTLPERRVDWRDLSFCY